MIIDIFNGVGFTHLVAVPDACSPTQFDATKSSASHPEDSSHVVEESVDNPPFLSEDRLYSLFPQP